MAVAESKVRANRKYREKFEYLQARLPAEEKEIITQHAAAMGESLNAFMRRAFAEAIERDKLKQQAPETE